MTPRISTEGKLLLCCSRAQIDAQTKDRIASLARQNPDWSHLREAAARNRVLPLVYNGLRLGGESCVPPAVLDELGVAAQAIAARNERNLSALLDILTLFKSEKIPAIPHKGVTFALFVYGNLLLRQCGDIDLLVPRGEFLKAKDLLIRHGHSEYYFGHAEVSTVQATLWHEDLQFSVDLHYALTPYYQHTSMNEARKGGRLERAKWNRLDSKSTYWFFFMDCEPLWPRRQSLAIGNRSVSILSPEDLLLVAAINGIKENWRRLVRVSDIAALVHAHPRIDWDRIFAQASAWRCDRKLDLGLLMAHRFCRMPVPPEILRRISASSTLRSLALQMRDRCCRRTHSADVEEFRLLCALYTMDGLRDRAWYFVYLIRRLRQFSFKASQYLAFFGKLIRQLGLSAAQAMRVSEKDRD